MKSITLDAKAQQALFGIFSQLQTTAEAQLFLEDLCTPAELQAMVDRWRVVEPIMNGKPYREIHAQTGVSVTTVGRVARVLRNPQSGYRVMWDRLESTD